MLAVLWKVSCMPLRRWACRFDTGFHPPVKLLPEAAGAFWPAAKGEGAKIAAKARADPLSSWRVVLTSCDTVGKASPVGLLLCSGRATGSPAPPKEEVSTGVVEEPTYSGAGTAWGVVCALLSPPLGGASSEVGAGVVVTAVGSYRYDIPEIGSKSC